MVYTGVGVVTGVDTGGALGGGEGRGWGSSRGASTGVVAGVGVVTGVVAGDSLWGGERKESWALRSIPHTRLHPHETEYASRRVLLAVSISKLETRWIQVDSPFTDSTSLLSES